MRLEVFCTSVAAEVSFDDKPLFETNPHTLLPIVHSCNWKATTRTAACLDCTGGVPKGSTENNLPAVCRTQFLHQPV